MDFIMSSVIGGIIVSVFFMGGIAVWIMTRKNSEPKEEVEHPSTDFCAKKAEEAAKEKAEIKIRLDRTEKKMKQEKEAKVLMTIKERVKELLPGGKFEEKYNPFDTFCEGEKYYAFYDKDGKIQADYLTESEVWAFFAGIKTNKRKEGKK